MLAHSRSSIFFLLALQAGPALCMHVFVRQSTVLNVELSARGSFFSVFGQSDVGSDDELNTSP